MPRNQRFHDLLHLHAPRTFHQQQIAGHHKARQKFGGLLGRGEKFGARSRDPRSHSAFHDLRRIAGYADDPINLPGLRGELSGLTMQLG